MSLDPHGNLTVSFSDEEKWKLRRAQRLKVKWALRKTARQGCPRWALPMSYFVPGAMEGMAIGSMAIGGITSMKVT